MTMAAEIIHEAARRGLLDLAADGSDDIMLGKYGSRWKHGYIPLNAAAVALKAKRLHGHAHRNRALVAHIRAERGIRNYAARERVPVDRVREEYHAGGPTRTYIDRRLAEQRARRHAQSTPAAPSAKASRRAARVGRKSKVAESAPEPKTEKLVPRAEARARGAEIARLGKLAPTPENLRRESNDELAARLASTHPGTPGHKATQAEIMRRETPGLLNKPPWAMSGGTGPGAAAKAAVEKRQRDMFGEVSGRTGATHAVADKPRRADIKPGQKLTLPDGRTGEVWGVHSHSVTAVVPNPKTGKREWVSVLTDRRTGRLDPTDVHTIPPGIQRLEAENPELRSKPITTKGDYYQRMLADKQAQRVADSPKSAEYLKNADASTLDALGKHPDFAHWRKAVAQERARRAASAPSAPSAASAPVRQAVERGDISVRRADALQAEKDWRFLADHVQVIPVGGAPSAAPAASKAGGIRIEHSAEGTIVHGTSRGDTATNDVLKANGFKWSRNLGAWYLPRTWQHNTRTARVANVRRALGDKVHVEAPEAAKPFDAEAHVAGLKAAAAERAARHTDRAARLNAASDAAYERSHAIGDRIPMGQPILVGHHSERRHRRDIAKMQSAMSKSVGLDREAKTAESRAASAASRAENFDAPGTATRRLERNEAELRRLLRMRDGTGKAIHGQDTPASEAWQRANAPRIAELQAMVERDRKVVGTPQFGKHNVKPGDTVQVGGRTYKVARVGPKAFTPMLDEQRGIPMSNYRVSWGQVTGHTPQAPAAAPKAEAPKKATADDLDHLFGKPTMQADAPKASAPQRTRITPTTYRGEAGHLVRGTSGNGRPGSKVFVPGERFKAEHVARNMQDGREPFHELDKAKNLPKTDFVHSGNDSSNTIRSNGQNLVVKRPSTNPLVGSGFHAVESQDGATLGGIRKVDGGFEIESVDSLGGGRMGNGVEMPRHTVQTRAQAMAAFAALHYQRKTGRERAAAEQAAKIERSKIMASEQQKAAIAEHLKAQREIDRKKHLAVVAKAASERRRFLDQPKAHRSNTRKDTATMQKNRAEISGRLGGAPADLDGGNRTELAKSLAPGHNVRWLDVDPAHKRPSVERTGSVVHNGTDRLDIVSVNPDTGKPEMFAMHKYRGHLSGAPQRDNTTRAQLDREQALRAANFRNSRHHEADRRNMTRDREQVAARFGDGNISVGEMVRRAEAEMRKRRQKAKAG